MQAITNEENIRTEVEGAFRQYLRAFAASDMEGIDSVVSYPLAHVGETEVRMFDSFPVDPSELRRAKGWHRTLNARHEVVAVSPTKAHVVLRNADRVRADDSLIERVSAFYAFKRTESGWKLFAVSDVVNPNTEAGV